MPGEIRGLGIVREPRGKVCYVDRGKESSQLRLRKVCWSKDDGAKGGNTPKSGIRHGFEEKLYLGGGHSS